MNSSKGVLRLIAVTAKRPGPFPPGIGCGGRIPPADLWPVRGVPARLGKRCRLGRGGREIPAIPPRPHAPRPPRTHPTTATTLEPIALRQPLASRPDPSAPPMRRRALRAAGRPAALRTAPAFPPRCLRPRIPHPDRMPARALRRRPVNLAAAPEGDPTCCSRARSAHDSAPSGAENAPPRSIERGGCVQVH